jgi:hypothetical protein
MDAHPKRISGNAHILLFAGLILVTFVVLFFSRSLDDNRLTSWQYVFRLADPWKVLFFLEAGILPALFLSKSPRPERHPIVFLFFFSYAAAALFWREPEVIVDASRYFSEAKHLELYGAGYFLREWGRAIPVWTDMPVVPFLYGLVFRWFGETRLLIEMLTTLLFSLTVVLTCLVGRELWGEEAGFWGGLLLLGIPYLYSQVPLMLVDLPCTFFLMFSVYSFIRALERGGAMIALSAAAIFITFFAKYSTWLMLTVLPVILAVYCAGRRSQGTDRYLRRGLVVFFAAGVLIGCFAAYEYDVMSSQMKLLIAYQKPGLRRWGESFVSTFFFQIWPWLTVAAALSLYRAILKRDLRFLIVLWLPLLIIALSIERIRYSVMAFPMIALAASFGITGLRKRETAKFAVYCIVVSSIVLATSAFLPFLERISLVNVEKAGAFLDHLNGDIRVYTVPEKDPVVNPAVAVPILDFFTNRRIRYDYTPSFQSDTEEILLSPLRFTFEYRNPAYYSEDDNGPASAVVVISSWAGQPLPAGIAERVRDFRRTKVFDITENVFRYQTVVTIYY